MGNKMLIDATHAEETRVVVVRDNRIEEFDFESAARKPLKGNIYLAKVTRVEPSLQAAFVDYGGNRHGFLAFSEIHPDYYQIPLADRQALLREQEEEETEHLERLEHDDESQHHDNDGNELTEDSAPEKAPHALNMEDQPSFGAETVPETGNDVESIVESHDAEKIEQIGAIDALEEVPERSSRRQYRRNYKIQEVIKRRQIILVQVVKEERGNKGAALTTYLSLAGRFCVLMPNNARGGGISRKITSLIDRRRLKDVMKDVEVPQGMGLIVRTAGAQRTKTEIKRDFDYLMRLWENVRDLTLSSQAPTLVYEEGSLIKRAIRDLYAKDVDEVIVEGESAYREAKDFMKMLMPSHAKHVRLFKDRSQLFSSNHIETQLDALHSPTVSLPSGGYCVINQTEALVAIDINSGKATREHNIEDTAVSTNLEAADEVARQLRLRDLAGLIVIDFIDMAENRNNRAVERRLKEALRHDRARIQVGRISHFGLLEMSRQRLRPGLLETSSHLCPHCEGRGTIRSIPSCGLSVLRSIEEYLTARTAENLSVKCHRDIAAYILNEKRSHLLSIEESHGISIFIVPHDTLKISQHLIERAGQRPGIVRKIQASPVKIEQVFNENQEAEEDIREEPPETIEQPGGQVDEEKTSADQLRENGQRPRRRSRRGRRGGRNREESMPPSLASADQAPVNPHDEVTETEHLTKRPPNQARGHTHRRPKMAQTTNVDDLSSSEEKTAPPAMDQENSQEHKQATPPKEPVHQDQQPMPIVENTDESRRWQPPSSTITTEPAPRKRGWWSRRS